MVGAESPSDGGRSVKVHWGWSLTDFPGRRRLPPTGSWTKNAFRAALEKSLSAGLTYSDLTVVVPSIGWRVG